MSPGILLIFFGAVIAVLAASMARRKPDAIGITPQKLGPARLWLIVALILLGCAAAWLIVHRGQPAGRTEPAISVPAT